MDTLSIFSYSNPRQFLLDSFVVKQKESQRFSIRAWAKEMELPSHTLLVMLLRGKRPLRVKHAPFLAKGLALSAQEKLYFQALLQFDSAQTPEEKELCALWLAELNPGKEFKIKEMDSFMAMSNWLYTAILSMTELKDFSFSIENIAERLKKKINLNEIQGAVERLFSLGLLIKDSNGKVKCTFQKVSSKNDIKDVGVRRYHHSSSDLAKEAVETVDPSLREFQSFSLSIDTTKMNLAKEMIRNFRAQFAKAIGSEAGDEVYQMNVQFFQLTECHAQKAEDEGVDTEESAKLKSEGPSK